MACGTWAEGSPCPAARIPDGSQTLTEARLPLLRAAAMAVPRIGGDPQLVRKQEGSRLLGGADQTAFFDDWHDRVRRMIAIRPAQLVASESCSINVEALSGEGRNPSER